MASSLGQPPFWVGVYAIHKALELCEGDVDITADSKVAVKQQSATSPGRKHSISWSECWQDRLRAKLAWVKGHLDQTAFEAKPGASELWRWRLNIAADELAGQRADRAVTSDAVAGRPFLTFPANSGPTLFRSAWRLLTISALHGSHVSIGVGWQCKGCERIEARAKKVPPALQQQCRTRQVNNKTTVATRSLLQGLAVSQDKPDQKQGQAGVEARGSIGHITSFFARPDRLRLQPCRQQSQDQVSSHTWRGGRPGRGYSA